MQDLTLFDIKRKEGCNFCEEGKAQIGEKSKYGSVVVLKTGDNPETDWYATLQPKTPSNPETGMNLLLMPLGHLEAFCHISSSSNLTNNFGKAFAGLSYAMQCILEKEWNNENGLYAPSQVVYGKCLTPENTKPHLHLRLNDFSGDISQAYPSDTSWSKRTIQDIGSSEEYVKANPVQSRHLSQERFDKITSKLIQICYTCHFSA